jgi:hypothetical protein
MKQTLKQITPPFLWNIARATNDSIRRMPELPAAYLHPWRRESIRRLAALKDIHQGKRAFVIANGPSLKYTDMSTALSLPKFLAWRSRRHFPKDLRITRLPTFLYTSYTGPRFSTDVRGRVWEGATVTNVTLQLAFHMGFQQVILIGVDHNYNTRGKPNTTVISQGDDPNHFSPSYFGKGFRWQLPDLDTSEVGYTMARQAYRNAGREVLDATIGGKLTIFPKVDYDSLF